METKNETTASKASKDGIHDVHDTFFRLVVGADPRIAVEILRPLPSQSLADQLSWDRMEAVPTAQVGVDKRMLHPDMIYRLSGTVDGMPIVVFFAMEHKSHSDHDAPTQLLAYMANLYRSYGTNGVLVIPVLVTQSGKGRGKPPTGQFFDTVRLPEGCRRDKERYAPMFEIAIVDLSDPDFDMGKYSIEAQALFSTMRLIRELADRDTLRWLLREKVRPAWKKSELGARLKEEIVWYIISVTEYDTIEEIEKIIDECLGKEVNIMSLADKLREEGVQVGIAKGEQLGIAKGEQLGIAKGEQLGIAKGEQVGIAKGVQVGRAEGELVGIAKGEQTGVAKGRIEDAIRMIRRNLNDDLIREITQLSAAEIERLRKTHND